MFGRRTRYYNTGKYVGEFSGDYRNGYGVYYYKEGDRYEGYWWNDLKHGKGIYYNVNGDVYEGEYYQDQRCGYGVCCYANGARYEGNWRGGSKNGEGYMRYANGSEYEGSWINGKKSGYGIMKYTNGNTFEGEFIRDAIYQGDFYFPNGNSYSGYFWEGNFHGEGTFYYKEGITYTGNFSKGKYHGLIKVTFSNATLDRYYCNGESFYNIFDYDDGVKYEGSLKDYRFNGYGTYIDEGQNKFRGYFNNGALEGLAMYEGVNGLKYYGEMEDLEFNGLGSCQLRKEDLEYYGYFEGDLYNGFGVLFIGDILYIGDFEYEEKCGYGIEKHSDFTYYGDFKSNKKDGFGIIRYNNNTMFYGEFKNDKMNGNGILFNKEDILLCGVFKDGECISNEGLPKDVVDKLFNSDKGKYKMFPYPDGSLYVGEMTNETRHGYGVFFNANKTQFVGEWKYDSLEGNVCIRYNDGKQYIGKLLNDEYHGKFIFVSYKNDIENYIVEIGKHNEGVKEGVMIQYKCNNEVTKFWHEQGKVHKILSIDKDKNLSLINYKNDVEHGEAFHIDSKSRKINTGIFEYGKLIK